MTDESSRLANSGTTVAPVPVSERIEIELKHFAAAVRKAHTHWMFDDVHPIDYQRMRAHYERIIELLPERS